jgi:hypothetical protein
MPAIPLPPEICPASYCYESTAIPDNNDHERHVKNVAFDPKAPHGYPTARPQPSSSSQPSITLTRMVPYGSGQQMYQGWGAFQPPPTSAAAQHQWQHAQVPPPMPAPGGPKKRAFICGINYLGTSAQLNGCINDAKCMEYLLKSKFGYTQEQILVQVDDHPDPMRRPTKANIFLGLQWLTSGMTPGDSLVFHYSGHGGQSRDYSGEEVDGFNETLLPMDHHHGKLEEGVVCTRWRRMRFDSRPFKLVLQKKEGASFGLYVCLNQPTISLRASIAVVSIGTSTVEVFSFCSNKTTNTQMPGRKLRFRDDSEI